MAPADNDLTLQTPRLSSTPPPRQPSRTLVIAAGAVAVVLLAVGAFVLLGDDGSRVRSEALRVTTPSTAAPAPSTTAGAAGQTGSPGTTSGDPGAGVKPPATSPPAPAQRLTSETRLSLDGLGPVDIGMTLDEASAAAGTPIRIRPDDPYGPECTYAYPQGGPDGVGFMVINGRIARVDIGTLRPEMRPSPVRTVSGIGIGSTEDEVKQAYPGRIRVEPAKYDPTGHDLVYVPVDASVKHLSMIFQTDGQRVTSFRAGLAEPVAYTEGCS
ncbi:MAG: hypothetical protein LC733_13590 [Actinobacteria bacterium]|nr:hypothetical protein [Actinomycetota bacterium]